MSGVVVGTVGSVGSFGSAIGGKQTVVSDGEINTMALHKAQDLIEGAAAVARTNYSAVIPTTAVDSSGGLTYTKTLTIPTAYATQCSQSIASTVSWSATYGRTLWVGATTTITNIPEMLALGGDCAITPPPIGGWNPPHIYAYDTFSGKPTALDALEHIAYMGEDNSPWLRIADARTVPLPIPHNGDLFIPLPYANNFNSTGKVLDQINDVDVYKHEASGKVYAFVATASTTAQLVVIDVTDIQNPTIAVNGTGILAKRNLTDVTATDSTAWGWRVYYYNGKLYITARETAGPELHIFDVTDPRDPTEIGRKELNTTVNDFVISNGLGYFAVQSDATGPLRVYNVATPTGITEVVGARGNIAGTENGLSIFLIGPRLYFGRQKNSGPEFYMLDASSPLTASGGLPILASKEIGDDVTDLRVVGPFAFAAVKHANEEFQVWPSDLSGPAINIYNFGNVINAGFDYNNEWFFVTGGSTPNFKILYSP